jgi:DNA-binding CsgD family transcriptional regulator/tetratricopeptide (TPR) repeat protein
VVVSNAFVGREMELAALSAAVSESAAGQSKVLWVEGDAGSGKTTLVRRALAAVPDPTVVAWASGDELATEVHYGVVSQLHPVTAGSPFGAGLELLSAFGHGGGLAVVVVEDLHWADRGSRLALLTMARRLEADGILLVVTSRPAIADDGWERLVGDSDRCQVVRLGGLSVHEVGALARAFGTILSPRAAVRLHSHTRGHPLYVRTLVTELTPEQLCSPTGSLPAPRSLAALTIAGLSQVQGASRELAAALAVLNQRVSLRLAAEVGQIDDPSGALDELLPTGLVVWWPAEVDTPIAFDHPLYRAAVYANLSPSRRRQLHLRAAEVADPETSLVHLVAAADQPDAKLAARLVAAAEAATSAGNLILAASYLLAASGLSADPGQRDQRLLQAGLSYLQARQTASAVALRPRIDQCAATPLRHLVQGRLAVDLADLGAAERHLRAGLDMEPRETPDDIPARAGLLAQMAWVCDHQLRGEEAVAYAEAALQQLDPSDHHLEHHIWGALAYGEGNARGPVDAVDRLAARLPESADQVTVADADLLITRGTLNFYCERYSAAIADFQSAIKLARLGADVEHLPRTHFGLSFSYTQAGRWDDAVTQARLSLDLAVDQTGLWTQPEAYAALALPLAYRGDWSRAEQALALARRAADRLGLFEGEGWVRTAEAALAHARLEHHIVVDRLYPLAGSGDPGRVPKIVPLFYFPTLVNAYLSMGDVTGAGLQIEQLEQLARERRRLDMQGRIMALRARLAATTGHPQQALERYAECLPLLGREPPVLERALIHQQYGRLLHARGYQAGARDQLGQAHDLLDPLDAKPYLVSIREDLAACGIRKGTSRRASRPLALTDREEDVAGLVAKGQTNREIGESLYISSKAVEYHLANIFRKLGINSRRQLRQLFATAG